MRKFIIVYFTLHIIVAYPCIAQTKFKFHAGVSNIEHTSLGIGWSFKNKHVLSFNYGSNFFIKTQNFSSFMLKYELMLNKFKICNFTPKTGVKGGYSIYTDSYYKWKILAVVPFIGVNYPINKSFDISCETGITFSQVLSMKRIKMGDVGWYKRVLPEIKLAVLYNL